MEYLLPVLIVLGRIRSTDSLPLFSPCGDGCSIRIQPLTNMLHCDCSGRRVLRNVHHHHNPPDNAPDTTIQHVTHEPLTTSNLRNVQATTSLCDNGCVLTSHPSEGWHFCVCPTPSTTPTTSTTTMTPAPLTRVILSTGSAQILFTSSVSAVPATPSIKSTNVPTITSSSMPATTSTPVPTSTTTHAPTTTITHAPTTTMTHAPTILTTAAPTIPTTHAPTQDICDILCAQQLGGDACNCSKPGLPG